MIILHQPFREVQKKHRMSQENLNALYALAEKIRSEHGANYDLSGLSQLQQNLSKTHDAFQQLSEKEQFFKVYAIGAFIGQCMIENLNGVWLENVDGMGIKLSEQGIWVDPFLVVRRMFQSENPNDSILNFYKRTSNFEMVEKESAK